MAHLLGFVLLLTLAPRPDQNLLAQARQAADLQVGHDFWGFKEGAPEDVSHIAQTRDGFLWLATPTGLFRFDGTRFERFRSLFGDQLLSNNIRIVFAPPSGGLWIGYTFGGFSFLDNNGRLTNYGGEPSSSGTVSCFAQDHNGNLWAGTTDGLWNFDGSLWKHLAVEWNAPARRVHAVAFDSQGVLWVLTGDAPSFDLLYLQPGTGHFQTAERNLHTYGFMLDANGVVVTGQGKPPVPNPGPDEQSFGYPITLKDSAAIIDRTGSIWVYGESGLRRLPPSDQPHQALNRPAVSTSDVYPVNPYDYTDNLVDREGNVWFGEAKGLHRFFYSPLARVKEVPKGAGWYAVAPDDDGAVWIATPNQLQHFSKGKSEAHKRLEGGVADYVNFAFRAADKSFWFATGREFWHLVGQTWTRVALPSNIADQVPYLQTITQDSKGGMWVSFGRHGLYRLADGVWALYGGHEDLPKTGVVIEFTDQQGRVWFGYTKNTIAVLDGDRVQVFGPSDGLRVGNVTAIQGRGAAIWIGGEFGLQEYDQGHFHEIHAVDDELLRGISGIVETANGDLWLNGLSGIFHIPYAEISEARKDPNYQVEGEHFGRREGLLGLAFQLRPLNTAVEGTDGRLWFTGSSGVVSVNPAQSEKKVPPPPTILSVSADDKFYPPGGPLKLPAHTSNVQISYAAVTLSDPEAISYRYKLQETDKDWHVVSTASPVSYRNLAPGSYHFNVNATDTNGVWSDKVATAEFTILPAFYQTRWFLVLGIAAALAVLYLLYVLRLRQVARQFRVRMEERVNERTRIARDLHDTLLQSFQGVLLLFQSVSNELQPGKTKQKLDSAVDQAQEAITEGRDAVQGLRSSTMMSGGLAAALGTLGKELSTVGSDQSPPAFHVEVEGMSRELKPILRDEVYRIASEALRNAFRHAQAGRVEVVIHYDDSQLIMHVRDDGKGIGSQILEGQGRVGHWGLQGMRERTRKIGGKLEVWSRPESGTEVELKIPAATAYQSWRARLNGFSFRRSSDIDTET